ncbi:MAG: RNA polymerase sigma factor [Rhizobiaceae bacterium]
MSGLSFLDDQSLVRKAQEGDRFAFGELCDRHYRTAFKSAWRRVGNRADAEDVAQDALVRMGQGLKTLREPALFRGWLMRIVINTVTDLQRRRKSERIGVAAFVAEGDTVWFDEDKSDRDAALWRAVRQLPDKQREAVTLVFAEELNHREAAETMGCKEATVSWHIHEAKKRLKTLLSEDAT